MALKEIPFYGEARLARMRASTSILPANRAVPYCLRSLSVGLWFECLRSRMGLSSAYALGQSISPERPGCHSNVWVKYAHAEHVPSQATQAAAEARYPGCRMVLCSPVWAALNVHEALGGCGESILMSLSAPVQLEVFSGASLRAGMFVRRDRRLREITEGLCGLGTLDSLAALVVMLRVAHEQGRRHDCFALGRALHDCLLLVGQDSPIQLIAEELFWYFSHFVLPFTGCRGVRIASSRRRLLLQHEVLSRLVLELEDSGFDYLPGMRHPLLRVVRNQQHAPSSRFFSPGVGPCSATSRQMAR